MAVCITTSPATIKRLRPVSINAPNLSTRYSSSMRPKIRVEAVEVRARNVTLNTGVATVIRGPISTPMAMSDPIAASLVMRERWSANLVVLKTSNAAGSYCRTSVYVATDAVLPGLIVTGTVNSSGRSGGPVNPPLPRSTSPTAGSRLQKMGGNSWLRPMLATRAERVVVVIELFST